MQTGVNSSEAIVYTAFLLQKPLFQLHHHHLYIHTERHTHVHTHTHWSTCMHMYPPTHTNRCTHIYTHKQMYTHTHKQMYTCIHPPTYICQLLPTPTLRTHLPCSQTHHTCTTIATLQHRQMQQESTQTYNCTNNFFTTIHSTV